MDRALLDLESAFTVIVDDLKALKLDQKICQQPSSRRQTEVNDLTDLISQLKKRINVVRDKKELLEDGLAAIKKDGGMEGVFAHREDIEKFRSKLDDAANDENTSTERKAYDTTCSDLASDIRCQLLLIGEGSSRSLLVDKAEVGAGKVDNSSKENAPSQKMAFLRKVNGAA